MLEVACGLICSSIPALKPFAAHFHLEARIRKFLHLRRKSSLKGKGGQSTYRSQSRLYSRPRLDSDSLMFDGGLSVTSMAVVTNGRLDRRASRSLETLKTPVETIAEEGEDSDENDSKATSPEVGTAEELGQDDMWINVRSSVTVIRGPVDEEAWT